MSSSAYTQPCSRTIPFLLYNIFPQVKTQPMHRPVKPPNLIAFSPQNHGWLWKSTLDHTPYTLCLSIQMLKKMQWVNILGTSCPFPRLCLAVSTPLRRALRRVCEEKTASSIDVPEQSELDIALEDIVEREKNANEEMASQKTSKQKNKLDDEEMHQRAMKKAGETKKTMIKEQW